MPSNAGEKVRVFLLGPFELKIKDQAVHLPTRKMEALLAYLVLHRTVQSRERLASLFWGDSPDELARRSLRTALSALRKELGEEAILTDRETLQLNPDFSIWVDAHEMEKQAKEILSSNHQPTTGMDPDLYRGDLLQDFYDEWVLEEREHYRTLFIDALLQFAQSLRTNGEYTRAISVSQKIISLDSANERAYQHLIFCHSALGDRSAALKSYEECAVQLQEKLGVSPCEETNALYEHAKKTNASHADLNVVKSNLPIPLTSFIGREQELKTLKDIFGKTRLLTLTGVGGCGKTRLSIELARQISDQFADGVWWVELASIQDEALVAQTIKRTLGLSDNQVDSLEESLLKFLHSKQILLVLDNCEHVIHTSARLAEKILSQCPSLKILATSREALSIHGEIAWLVPSLSLPPSGQMNELLKWECPRLFFERATSYRSDLQLTASNAEPLLRICRALEGIPLAIELAAARVKTLSLEQLASRLDDKLGLLTTGSRIAQPRQQTLRAAIDWSYELLSEQEQTVLRRLSVFYGNWTLEAAEFVCADNDIDSSEILDLITRLLDKSLIISENHDDEIHYRMLEIIRQYAMEKLQEAGVVQEVHDHHTRYYSELAQRVRPAWYTKEQSKLIQQFNAHYPNLRVALAWGLENPKRLTNWEYGLKLAIALTPLWTFEAEFNEGRAWLQKGIDQINATLVESGLRLNDRNHLLSLKARALYECGSLVWYLTQYSLARTIFLESSELYREIEDPVGLAYSNLYVGHSMWVMGQKGEARQMWQQSLQQLEEAADLWGQGMAHSFIGRGEREVENYEVAEHEYNQCFKLFSELGDDWGLGISLSHLGMFAFQKGDFEKARELFEQRWNLSKKNGFKHSLAYSSLLVGIAYWKLGDHAKVQRFLSDALMYFHQIGNQITVGDCLIGLAWVQAEKENLEKVAYLLGAAEKASQIYWVRIGFEDLYFHKPIREDLQMRLENNYEDAKEKGRIANLDEVVKELLRT